MKSRTAILGLAVWAVSLASASNSLAEMRWLKSISEAQSVAAQSNRLILVHFWSTQCQPCLKLEQTVYNQPEIGQLIGASFVPVKINTDEFPAVARQYEIKSIPADVVLSSDGKVIARRGSPLTREEYMAGLQQLAAAYATKAGGAYAAQNPAVQAQNSIAAASAYAQPPVGPRYAPMGGAPMGSPVSLTSNQVATPPVQSGYAPAQPPVGYYQQPGRVAGALAPVNGSVAAPVASTSPLAGQIPASYANPAAPAPSAVSRPAPTSPLGAPQLQSPAPQPSSEPQVALDGHCAVTLIESEQWRPADPQWGAIHRGKLYLFAGPEQQKKFMQNPDAFSPVLSGNDPVIAVEQSRLIPGHRRHGVFCDGRIYLFAGEATLNQFSKDPLRYVQGIRQAEMTGRLVK